MGASPGCLPPDHIGYCPLLIRVQRAPETRNDWVMGFGSGRSKVVVDFQQGTIILENYISTTTATEKRTYNSLIEKRRCRGRAGNTSIPEVSVLCNLKEQSAEVPSTGF